MSSSIWLGSAVWSATVLLHFFFLRKVILNLLDPLFIASISVSFSAALIAVLGNAGAISADKLLLFVVVLVAYLFGGYLVGLRFSVSMSSQILLEALSRVSSRQITAILTITASATIVLALLGFAVGGLGDARQEFSRAFRPLVLIQNGLLLISILLLSSPRYSTSKAVIWLLGIVLGSIPFSGKSVFLPVLYWFCLRIYVGRTKLTIRSILWMCVIFFFGVGIMGVLAYGATNLLSVLSLFTTRLWLAGDVYIFAYQQGALEGIRANYPVSFSSYMLHPITSLFGFRAYDKPLGAMLSSEVNKDDLFTGPNPQLPVVLDYFFPSSLITSFFISCAMGFLVIGIRLIGTALARNRSTYARIGAFAAAVFCPPAGFLDTSQVLITFIGIVVITAGVVTLEIASIMWRRDTSEPENICTDDRR